MTLGLADVSRETLERLDIYARLLEKWNPRINLVAKSTIPDLHERHFRDSAQLWKLVKARGLWADLGSGGGFPGMVIAILAADGTSHTSVCLVESDRRKAEFLRTVARETGVTVDIRAERIERLDPLGAAVLSARALADLTSLLDFATRHLQPDGTALFPKGVTWEKEVSAAREQWNFDLEVIRSELDPASVILKIKSIGRA